MFQFGIVDPLFDNDDNPYVEFKMKMYSNLKDNDFSKQPLENWIEKNVPLKLCQSFHGLSVW